MIRVCKKCNFSKEIAYFRKSKNCKNGYSHTCLECSRALQRAWSKNHFISLKKSKLKYNKSTKGIEKNKQYYLDNKQEIDAKHADYYNKYKDKIKYANLKKKYNISKEDLDTLYTRCGASCSICKLPEKENQGGKALHVDHDHKTGKVRGLLCNNCNLGIGYLKDDVKILESAIEYLCFYGATFINDPVEII